MPTRKSFFSIGLFFCNLGWWTAVIFLVMGSLQMEEHSEVTKIRLKYSLRYVVYWQLIVAIAVWLVVNEGFSKLRS